MSTDKKRITGYVSGDLHKLFVVYCQALNLSESKAIEVLLRKAISGDKDETLTLEQFLSHSDIPKRDELIQLIDEKVSQGITEKRDGLSGFMEEISGALTGLSDRVAALERSMTEITGELVSVSPDGEDDGETPGMSRATLEEIFIDSSPEYLTVNAVAESYSVNRSTLSQWLSGKKKPGRPDKIALLKEIQEKYDYVPGKGLRRK